MIKRNGSPRNIAVHHSAVKPGAKNMEELKARARSANNYHKAKSIAWNNTTLGEYGYKYIRYHYMIAQDGSVLQVQDEKYVLYHASDGAKGEFNYWGIGISLSGNYEIEKPTAAQKESLAKLIAKFELDHKVNVTVRGHKQVAQNPTACPGKNVGTHDSGWLKTVIARANEILSSPEIPVDPCDVLQKENNNLKKELSNNDVTIKTLQAMVLTLQKDLEKAKDLSNYTTVDLVMELLTRFDK